MCGEYLNPELHPLNQLGSPPHTWRILLSAGLVSATGGITSTYVENTLLHHLIHLQYRDHLHIRGEYFIKCRKTTAHNGSPPHTWRIRAGRRFSMRDVRITSTYVENTHQRPWIPVHYQDHLHIRGEYGFAIPRERTSLGSPPHTWRIHTANKVSFISVRITSTYVENTPNNSSFGLEL